MQLRDVKFMAGYSNAHFVQLVCMQRTTFRTGPQDAGTRHSILFVTYMSASTITRTTDKRVMFCGMGGLTLHRKPWGFPILYFFHTSIECIIHLSHVSYMHIVLLSFSYMWNTTFRSQMEVVEQFFFFFVCSIANYMWNGGWVSAQTFEHLPNFRWV